MVFGSPGAPVRWSEGVLCRLAGLRLPIRGIPGQLTLDRTTPASCSKVRIWFSVSA